MKPELNKKILSKAKKEAKEIYNENIKWSKLSKRQKLQTTPPSTGFHLSDCSLYYKTNGFRNFNGYVLLIHKTKTEYSV